MFEDHSRLIDELGGTTPLARLLGTTDKVVSRWRRCGIADHWRPTVAALARRRRLRLPDDFLAPRLKRQVGQAS